MRKSGGGGVALLLALLLAACGSSNISNSASSDAALMRIRNAVQRTEAAGTAHLVTDSLDSGVGSSSANHLTIVGDIRFAGPDLSLTSTVQTQNSSASPPEMQVCIGTSLYLNASSNPGDWVRGTCHQPYAYLGVVPTKALMATEGPVTEVRVQEQDGERTTEYMVPIPASVQSVAATHSNNQPYKIRISVAPFVLSVWLDGAGRIVRTQGTLRATSSRKSGSSVQRTTTTLSDFGKVVHIVAPAHTLGS
jgi:hypothetical protein